MRGKTPTLQINLSQSPNNHIGVESARGGGGYCIDITTTAANPPSQPMMMYEYDQGSIQLNAS